MGSGSCGWTVGPRLMDCGASPGQSAPEPLWDEQQTRSKALTAIWWEISVGRPTISFHHIIQEIQIKTIVSNVQFLHLIDTVLSALKY